MVTAIVGGRRKWFKDISTVKNIIRGILWTLPPGSLVVTGDEPTGVDRWVREIIEKYNIPVRFESFKAYWDDKGLSAGTIRNTEVIEKADTVHVIWNGSSPGSRDVVNKVRWIEENFGTKSLFQHIVR